MVFSNRKASTHPPFVDEKKLSHVILQSDLLARHLFPSFIKDLFRLDHLDVLLIEVWSKKRNWLFGNQDQLWNHTINGYPTTTAMYHPFSAYIHIMEIRLVWIRNWGRDHNLAI